MGKAGKFVSVFSGGQIQSWAEQKLQYDDQAQQKKELSTKSALAETSPTLPCEVENLPQLHLLAFSLAVLEAIEDWSWVKDEKRWSLKEFSDIW